MSSEEIHLKNGIILAIDDNTMPLSGGLHMVKLTFSIKLQLDKGDTELRSYCGDYIVRSRVFDKSGVRTEELDAVRKRLKESFISTSMPYLDMDKFLTGFKDAMLREMRDKALKERLRNG